METSADVNIFAMFLPLILIALIAIPIWWRIASKAGYSGWWSLAVMVPGVNFVLLVLFAIVEWPVERQLKRVSQERDTSV